MQLANFIAVQPLQHILRQPGGVIVKNKLAAGDADNPGAVGPDQLHRMQVYHHADTLLANLAQHIHDALSVFRIQRGDRLVGQQDPGFCISARQIATRCICPPERFSARCSACGSMFIHSSSAMARARSAAGKILNSDFRVEVWLRRPSRTLVSTSRRGTRQKS